MAPITDPGYDCDDVTLFLNEKCSAVLLEISLSLSEDWSLRATSKLVPRWIPSSLWVLTMPKPIWRKSLAFLLSYL